MSEKNLPNIFAIQDSCSKIIDFTAGIGSAEEFYQDQKAFDAVLMNFIVIGESVSKLSLDLKNQFPNVEWNKIKSFRNIVAHNYFGVDADEVWQIISSDIASLQKSIEAIIVELEK